MGISTKKELIDLIISNSQRLKKYGVLRIGLFGSFARNEPTSSSDIDLLVEFESDKKTFDNFIELAYFLEDATDRGIDIVTPESLSPYIGPHILSEVEYYAL
jgi:predicted nucleotidyltransferase